MTEEEKQILLSQSPANAAADLCSHFEDMALMRPLTPCERHAITVKVIYWWSVAQRKCIQQALDKACGLIEANKTNWGAAYNDVKCESEHLG